MIECFRLTDYSIAMATMKECWEEMCEDDAVLTVPDLINEYWIGVNKDKVYAGFIRVAQVTSVLYECHVCVLKKFRRYLVEIGVKVYEWILGNIVIEKLVSNIPEFNKGALSWSKKMGFTFQGSNSNAYKRGGKLYPMIQLGITREKMEQLCHPQQ